MNRKIGFGRKAILSCLALAIVGTGMPLWAAPSPIQDIGSEYDATLTIPTPGSRTLGAEAFLSVDNGATVFVVGQIGDGVIEYTQNRTGAVSFTAAAGADVLTLILTLDTAQFVSNGVVVAEVFLTNVEEVAHWGMESLHGNAALPVLVMAVCDNNLHLLSTSMASSWSGKICRALCWAAAGAICAAVGLSCAASEVLTIPIGGPIVLTVPCTAAVIAACAAGGSFASICSDLCTDFFDTPTTLPTDPRNMP